MRDFCTAIGELILWASLIDGQLNRALLGMMALPEHAMIEPIIAQLDSRPKAELLKKRAKIITSKDWKNKITNWVVRAEKANAKRNTVAHHGIRVSGVTISLHSDQLAKIFGSLDTSDGAIKQSKAKGLADIHEWIREWQLCPLCLSQPVIPQPAQKRSATTDVGDGEADPAAGLVAVSAPLCRATTGSEVVDNRRATRCRRSTYQDSRRSHPQGHKSFSLPRLQYQPSSTARDPLSP